MFTECGRVEEEAAATAPGGRIGAQKGVEQSERCVGKARNAAPLQPHLRITFAQHQK